VHARHVEPEDGVSPLERLDSLGAAILNRYLESPRFGQLVDRRNLSLAGSHVYIPGFPGENGRAGERRSMIFMVFFFAVVLGFTVLGVVRMYRGHDEEGDEGPSGEDGPPWRRGGGGRPPKGPRPRNPEPSWWPEFEREFRLYASAQRAHRQVSRVGS
jgi:hypothetical protein